MTKRIIGVLTVLILCLNSFSFIVFAQDGRVEYSDFEKESIRLDFAEQEPALNSLFCSVSAVGYWNMVNRIEENTAVKWSIDQALKLLEEDLTEYVYAEILANLIVMQSEGLAVQIQNQSQFDNIKDSGDYVIDIIDIAAGFVSNSKLLKNISPIVETANDGIDVVVKNVEHAKYYATAIKDYSCAQSILNAVSRYAGNGLLKKAAHSLLKANDTLLEKRLQYITNTAETLAEYEAKFFIDNMSFELLKSTDLYATDDIVKKYVDQGVKICNAIKSIKTKVELAYKITILVGDITFGTTNTFKRYREMKAISEIVEAIAKANNQITVLQTDSSEDALNDIKMKCEYYKMLIISHARGEYLVYQLLINDAGLMSKFRADNPEDTTESWYNSQVACLEKYYNILEDIFDVSDISRSWQLPNEKEYNEDNELVFETQYTYSEDGRLINKTIHEYLYSSTVIYRYEYDNNGILKTCTQERCFEDGEVITVTYTYDTCGNVLTEITDALEVAYGREKTYEYTYDELGRMLSMKRYADGKFDMESFRTYNQETYTEEVYNYAMEYSHSITTYDMDDKPLKSVSYLYDETGNEKVYSETTYDYDEMGQLIKINEEVKKISGYDGLTEYEHVYDDHGNVVSTVEIRHDTIVSKKEYEYVLIEK